MQPGQAGRQVFMLAGSRPHSQSLPPPRRCAVTQTGPAGASVSPAWVASARGWPGARRSVTRW